MINARRIVVFNVLFWFVAAAVLFANAWPNARQHFDVAYVRYGYFVVVGLLASVVLMFAYGSSWFTRQRRRFAWIVALSITAALVTAFLINPITYMMAGHNIHTVPIEIMTTGTLYFALLFVIWSALYLQLKGESVLHASPADPDPGRAVPVFQVEKQGEIRQVRADDIVCVRANGDYVDLVTTASSYLKKDTMANLEAVLDPERFKRVHRSAIVNSARIERVSPRPGGVFVISLEGGQQVQSSRGYRAVVEALAPSG